MMHSSPNSPDHAFTHLRDGAPAMVDVTGKAITHRSAEASAYIQLSPDVLQRMANGEINGPKGPVFNTAIIAATMAAKSTGNLIPFCHPLPIENCEVRLSCDESGVEIRCRVATTGKTGVEMEALTGACVAALTVYDMTKALDKCAVIREVKLLGKSGGKSGDYHV